MKDPCTACIHLKQETVGHRKFVGCIDETKKEGFEYDNFMYWHKCKNHIPKENCLNCKKYSQPYCNNVYSDCMFESL